MFHCFVSFRSCTVNRFGDSGSCSDIVIRAGARANLRVFNYGMVACLSSATVQVSTYRVGTLYTGDGVNNAGFRFTFGLC